MTRSLPLLVLPVFRCGSLRYILGRMKHSRWLAEWSWSDLLVAAFLFTATAAIVVWQNSRLGVLWDLSYILENSYRISLGDMPYRDFPFPYAPLTFMVQAVIIKLTGRVFWHHIVY